MNAITKAYPLHTGSRDGQNPAKYPYISKIVMLLFCGYVIVWYLQIGERWPVLATLRIEFMYAVLLSVFLLFYSRTLDLNCPLYKYLLLYMVVLLIQIPLSADFETSLRIFVDRILKFSFLGIAILILVRSPTNLKYFLGAFFFACMKMGQEGLVGKITGGTMWENQGIMRLHGTTSLYSHPNSYAGMALGTVPFIFCLWPISRWIIRAILAVQMLFAVNIILYSGSRTAYVGLIGLLLFFWLGSKAKKKLALYGVIIFLVGFVAAPSTYLERFQSIYTLREKEGASSTTRIEILKDAVQIFATHPFGVGIGAFPAVRREFFGRVQDTHNLFLEIATNLGVQGLFVFALLLFKVLQMLSSIERNADHQVELLNEMLHRADEKGGLHGTLLNHISDLRLIKATASGVYLFVLTRLILGLFGMDLYEIYWWFAFGMTIALFNMNRIANRMTNAFLLHKSTTFRPDTT